MEDAGGEEAVTREVEARLAKELKDSAQLRVVTGRCVGGWVFLVFWCFGVCRGVGAGRAVLVYQQLC